MTKITGRLPQDWVDEVYDRTDIVQVVSSYLPLKKSGRNYLGLCPFHHEKTPSFSVNGEQNVYHCFGCKAGGNVVQFVMEMERITYPEALLHLGKLINMPEPHFISRSPEEERTISQRQRIFEANKAAARYYHDRLWTPQGETALSYLHKRGLTDSVIRQFGLGVSPDLWSGLMDHLLAEGFKEPELEAAGLIVAREKSSFDFFRNRVMFPIIDQHGNTLAFGGRSAGDQQPKYLNTGDTLVFNKRQGLYGVHMLKRQRQLTHIILVEGYLDVISLVQAGITGVVATLGTALSPEQARLIKRFAPEVLIAYDGDEAGQMAAARALDVCAAEAMPARVMPFPPGEDPDDFIKKRGVEGFNAIRPVTATGFRIKRLATGYDMNDPDAVTAFAMEAIKIISRLTEPVQIDRHLRALSQTTGIGMDTLIAQLGHGGQSYRPATVPKPRYGRRRPEGRQTDRAQEVLITLLASGFLPPGMVSADDFDDDFLSSIASRLCDGEKPSSILISLEDSAQVSQLSALFAQSADVERDKAVLSAEETMARLRDRRLKAQIAALKQKMIEQDAAGQQETLREILALQGQAQQGSDAQKG